MRHSTSTWGMTLGLLGLAVAWSCGTEPTVLKISLTVSPPTVNVVTGGSQDLSATLANDPAGKGVGWSITCCTGGAKCGTLANATIASVTYTAPRYVPLGSGEVTVWVTATSALISGLEYPTTGLWIKDGRVYLTETAGCNTTFGGKIDLLRYDVTTKQTQVLLNDAANSDAVVVSMRGIGSVIAPGGTI